MTAKRFELKIPLDLLEKIEEAARDYFKSPKNHTSKKPELTSPILKLIEKGLEKIAELPYTDIDQRATERLSDLIDEKIKSTLSVYKLDELQASINNLQRAVFSSGNRPEQTVYNPDTNEIVTPDDIPDSRSNGSFLFSVELPESTVDDTDQKSHPGAREGEDKGDKGERKDLAPNSPVSPDSFDSSVSIDLPSVTPTQIETVLNPDKSATAPESMDNHNTPERNSTDSAQDEEVDRSPNDDGNQFAVFNLAPIQTVSVSSPNRPGNYNTPEKNSTNSIQAVSVDESPNDDGNQKAIEEASAVGTESVSSPDTASNDTTQADGGQEKSLAKGAKVTLKGAWRHAQDKGFKGSVDEFRSLFKLSGDVHYGVKILYFSGAGSSRNYEKHG